MERKTKDILFYSIVIVTLVIMLWLLVYVYQFERTCKGCIERGTCVSPVYNPYAEEWGGGDQESQVSQTPVSLIRDPPHSEVKT